MQLIDGDLSAKRINCRLNCTICIRPLWSPLDFYSLSQWRCLIQYVREKAVTVRTRDVTNFLQTRHETVTAKM
jgi:hypothetical protein